MKRFDFPLDRVRRWRRSQLELEELKAQRLIQDLHRIDEQKRQLWADREKAEAAVLLQANVQPVDLAALDSFRQHVRLGSRKLDLLRAQQEAKIEKQREQVLESKRRFELLDRLGSKALAEWRGAFSKEQEDLASELFLARMNRSSPR